MSIMSQRGAYYQPQKYKRTLHLIYELSHNKSLTKTAVAED